MSKRSNEGWSIQREINGVLLLALGLFLSLSLFSFNPSDPCLNAAADTAQIHNWAGLAGAYTADIFITTFGVVAFLAPPIALILAVMQFASRNLNMKWSSTIGGLLLLVFTSALIHLRWPNIGFGEKAIPGGGIIGGLSGGLLLKYLNTPGAYLLAATIMFISFSLTSGISPIRIFGWFGKLIKMLALKLAYVAPAVLSYTWRIICAIKATAAKLTGFMHRNKEESDVEEIKSPQSAKEETKAPKQKSENSAPPKIIKAAAPKQKQVHDEQLVMTPVASGYTPPPLSLLDAVTKKASAPNNEILQKNSVLVEKKLSDFGVAGRVTAIHPGPVITMYEFEPAAGTKVSKIANLEDDLSLTLGGKNVRIIPHLPGRAAVGIEVPNSQRDNVCLKDILTSQAFQRASAKLPLPVGLTADGHPFVTDLTKMPHMLIAGATGSGKSVAINTLIVGLLYKLPPEKLRFIMIDPKMLELSTYQGIPHLLLPVVTKPKLAVRALRWAVAEMERRYKLLSNAGARNLPSYNQAIDEGKIRLVTPEQAQKYAQDKMANGTTDTNAEELILHTGKLPYLVIVIDELADLMMTASQDMEDLIVRLAQMARAAGIHLVLATQRPSVDIITGLIKANFPARIAFKVSSRHDSRTILDGIGAEALLGAGDMLYMPPAGSSLLRLHGAFISEPEVSRIVSHLVDQGTPQYDETILTVTSNETAEEPELETEEDNQVYDQAVKLIAETKQASISMIQRRLRIGYNRAARIIEKMEAQGVVGPADGSKPREVLISQTK